MIGQRPWHSRTLRKEVRLCRLEQKLSTGAWNMRWATYFAVLASVLSVGLALGVSMPLVSLRLESWGYGAFAIGVMAAMPAIGVLVGAGLASRFAARLGKI